MQLHYFLNVGFFRAVNGRICAIILAHISQFSWLTQNQASCNSELIIGEEIAGLVLALD